MCIGLYSFESGGLLVDDILDARAVADVYAAVASCEDVRVEWLDIDVAGLRGLAFTSSRWTLGPPASEHGTLCLTQFAHGDSSLHLTCRLLHCAQPFRDFLCPTRGALFTLLLSMVNQSGAMANIV